MPWYQKDLVLAPLQRGCHLITKQVIAQLPELKHIDIGLLHVFIKHSSASLTLNENASAEVRGDLERHLN